MSQQSANPALPLYLMAKPVGDSCNLSCSYCYYRNKSRGASTPVFDSETLINYIKNYIAAQTGEFAHFIWHGGEPMLAGLDFYRRVLQLQDQYAGGKQIYNTIQTNGTLIDDEWCRFFKANGWLVGISIDGPQAVHDAFRCNNAGCGSHAKVLRGIELLKRYGVEWNAMAVVNSLNVNRPEEFYDYFKSIGCKYLQFTPIVERAGADGLPVAVDDDSSRLTAESVTPEAWGEFLCRVFDRWVRADVGEVFVQIFDATLANWLGAMPGLCTMSATCGHAGVVELNGDVYCCDHFVYDRYRLGNINSDSLSAMMGGERQQAFARMKSQGLSQRCRECRYLFACHGECPKNRWLVADGQRQNYLCEGYRRYFDHVAPHMDFMAGEIRANRSPANIMKKL